MNRKPPASFEPLQNLQVAWGHFFLGIDQHILASFHGINPGRVNEACRAIGYAMSDPKKFLALVERDDKTDVAELGLDAVAAALVNDIVGGTNDRE